MVTFARSIGSLQPACELEEAEEHIRSLGVAISSRAEEIEELQQKLEERREEEARLTAARSKWERVLTLAKEAVAK